MLEEAVDRYELSDTQAGMLFASRYRPDTGVYVEQRRFELTGTLDPARLERSWQTVVARHDALRTVIEWDDGGLPRQAVRPAGEPGAWHFEDCSAASDPEQRIDRFLEGDRRSGFALAGEALTRMALFRMGADRHHLVWTFHHLLLDGRSIATILDEVCVCYRAYRADTEPLLPAPVPFRQYIDWLRAQPTDRAGAFWRERLRGFPGASLWSARSRGAAGRTPPGSSEVDLDLDHVIPDLDLRAIARERRTTVNTLLSACWLALLGEHTGTTDVTTGVTVTVPFPALFGAAPLVGLCIGTVPLRVEVEPTASYDDWLRTVQHGMGDALTYSWQSIAKIKAHAGIPPDEQVFDGVLSFHEGYRPLAQQAPLGKDLTVTRLPSRPSTEYALVLAVWLREDVYLRFSYRPSVLTRAEIAGLARRYEALLRASTHARTVDELIERVKPHTR